MGTIWSREVKPAENTEQDSPAPVEDDACETRKKEMEEDMIKFKAELAAKREARKEAIASLNRKICELKEEAEKERKERERLELLLEDGAGSREEVEGLEMQVRALKDVASIGGEMLKIRELQVNELKEKIQAIEETGVAYEKEVENMRKLKGLYEERSRAMAITHQMEIEREKARLVAAETRLEIAEEKNRELLEAKSELEERISALDGTVDKNNNEISELRVQLAGKKEELYHVTSQMTIVNNLFSQVLSDPENLDRVNRVLEEHHNLVNHLTEKGKITDVASVLMTVADKDHVLTEEEQDIATNLSKVWRLLVELLGHHNKHTPEDTMPDSCYKSVDTPSGPKLVISVSKTFLRLKDLILEKNCLVKEVGRLKDLNCHLEKRLISQETRLAEVADELHITWGVVNKLRTQHKALHTHEQVLRYELKHKRLMLNELKEQLEDCREMWQMARVKNSQTEKDWILLRKEFADRKQQFSNAESGYEESPGDSQDEEDIHKLSDEETDSREEPVSEATDEQIKSSSSDRPNTPESFDYQKTHTEEVVLDSKRTENQDITESGPSNHTSTRDPEIEVCNEHATMKDEVIHVSPPLSIQSNPSDTKHVNERLTPVFLEPSENTISIETGIHILPWDDENSSDIKEEEHTKCELDSSESSTNVQETVQNMEGPETKDEPAAASDPNGEGSSLDQKKTTAEEILDRREARLRRLEEQCKSLFNKMNDTNIRSELISNKLVELHEHYGESRTDAEGAPTACSETLEASSLGNEQTNCQERDDEIITISSEQEVNQENTNHES